MSDWHSQQRPKKRYGQHFLHQTDIVRRIIAAINPQPGDTVLEIGPGEGVLTLPLLERCATLTVIELDTDLIEPLRRRAHGHGLLKIIHGDVLQTDLGKLAAGRPLRIVGNLPYYISSPILFHSLRYTACIQDMHFMLQREVVERMAASPGGKEYGRLSVMLQLVCRVEPLFQVPANAFRPPPKVESAMVRLIPERASGLDGVDLARLEHIVRAGFSQRRKILANALRGLLDAEAIRALGLRPEARAETLSPAEFIRLAKLS